MLAAFEKIMLVVQPIALAVLLIYIYGLLCRTIGNQKILNSIMGFMFGFAAMVAMLSPIPIAEGVIVDIRSLFIGIAAAYFGILGGLIALLAGAVMRVQIGGDGMMLGVGAMLVSSAMGCLWAILVKPRIACHYKSLLILGGMISMHLAVALLLPSPVQARFFQGLGPVLLTANMLGSVLLGTLIRREKRLADEAARLLNDATTDPLTMLSNRKAATAAFDALPPLRNRTSGQSMLCIDIDGFKQINDTKGHLFGDRVLVEIAQRVGTCLRPDDIFSRISGDEFIIVLHGVSAAQAIAIAERCRAAVSESPIFLDGVRLHTSISVGAVWSRDRQSFKGLREIADDALYRAKGLGRNRVAFEIDGLDEKAADAAVA